MRSVRARAPVRIDFGGGWTDVPPYSVEQGGRVCNVAIALYSHVHLSDGREDVARISEHGALADVALRRAGLTGVTATITNEFPLSAGLGGSSAAGVAMAAAMRIWQGDDASDRAAIAEESRATEVEELGIAGGRQDHYASALGGLLDLTFSETAHATSLPLSAELRNKLEAQCVLVYTGASRISATTITAVLDGYRRSDSEVTSRLHGMKQLAGEMVLALRREDVNGLGMLVDQHWTLQRGLHSGITTPIIDEIMKSGKGSGAIGGKALGASGGGCVVLIAEEGAAASVRAAVARLVAPLPFTLDSEGVTATESAQGA